MTLSNLTRALRHSDFKHRLRDIDCDRRTIHSDSSFHRDLWTQGDFGTPMPYKSREESIPSDEIEQAGGGGVEMRGQLGDLISETAELVRRHSCGPAGIHERVPLCAGATLHRGFSAAPEARCATIARGS
jgi:hypothetical protein